MNTWWRLVQRGASEEPLVGKMPLLDVTPFKRSPVCGQCGHSPDLGGGCLFDLQLNSSVVVYLFVLCLHPAMIPTSNVPLPTIRCKLCFVIAFFIVSTRTLELPPQPQCSPLYLLKQISQTSFWCRIPLTMQFWAMF